MDGLKLKFQASTNLTEQSMYYNGWQHGHYITNLIVFSACGRIIACVLNVPGSVHDSTLAEWGGIYDKLEETYERTGAICCADLAFASAKNDFIIRSAQDERSARNALEVLQIPEATAL